MAKKQASDKETPETTTPEPAVKRSLIRRSKRVDDEVMFDDTDYVHEQIDRLIFALEAFRDGDTSVRLAKERNDKFADLAYAYNSMVDLIGGVSGEVSRISKVGGIEGNLEARAEYKAAHGVWKELIDNINILIGAIAKPVFEVNRTLNSIAEGNLKDSFKLTVTGDFRTMADVINRTFESLNMFADQVTLVAREVGIEGKLGGQAYVPNVSGTWKDLTENVNQMAGNLTSQVREIATVTTSVANGDLSRKITEKGKGGEVLELSRTINTMVDSLNVFAAEVSNVAREVGIEGKLGGQAEVPNVAGIWKSLTDNVNLMANNLTNQVREIANVSTAIANGDLSQKISINVRGEIASLKNTINSMVDSLTVFASEVTRVAREVGTEGKLGGQAQVPGVAGTWKSLTDNVNIMASNLTSQVREIANVTTAVAQGDLSQKISEDEKNGEVLALSNTINNMVDSLNLFSEEVTRVANEVGTKGILGGQAQVPNVAGTWKALTENVNQMASNLTSQVREIAKVATAVANGDLDQKISIEAEGEIDELKQTINRMVDSLNIFSDEVTRVAREVGTEGVLGGQAQVPDVGGTWKDLTDNVNYMASNLTEQVREIAKVATAVAKGDLNQKITIEARGEIAQLKETINQMVDSLNIFSDEVSRVAKEVGTEGILGGQARVPNVAGSWADLTGNVNVMASNLTTQVREISQVATAIASGDLSQKISEEGKGGEVLKLSRTINGTVDSLNLLSREVTRVAREVGTEGELGGQAKVPNVAGAWLDLTNNVNTMASNLTSQVREIAAVATAVANGDLNKKITIDVKGEINSLKTTINQMVDSLTVFASEVTRVAREVGTEGKLGGKAEVPNVAGTWADLTSNVNQMASNLTTQVREIAEVTTSVANGDLSRKISMQGKGGEVLQLSQTINRMVDALNTFADEVTNVAREVGTEGKLGGQAHVPNVAGSWKDLTDSVNYMANNLTNQVRDIASVSTALTQGNFSKKIQVEAFGEVLELKNNINTMVDSFTSIVHSANTIAKGDFSIDLPLRSENDQLGVALNSMSTNLRRISEENEREAWIKTGQAGLNDRMRGEQDLHALMKNMISYLTKYLDAQVGVVYLAEKIDDEIVLKMSGSYAFTQRRSLKTTFKASEGLVGQSLIEKEPIVLSNVDRSYLSVGSGLGEKEAANIVVYPFILEGEVKGVIEIGSFKRIRSVHLDLLNVVSENVAIAVNSAFDRERMRELLEESRKQSDELLKQQERLREQSEELQAANAELEAKTTDLEEQKEEISASRKELEQKAQELEQASKYKSEFLANMSHELRTPLNSLLILANDLQKNETGNLSEEQVKDASIIHEGGKDLLNLINDILDLSKVEAGKMTLQIEKIKLASIRKNLENQFTPVAERKDLEFIIKIDEDVPESLITDSQRLEQIIKNLLSNAFKFTEKGSVTVHISKQRRAHESLDYIAFSVEDTGVGISNDKQQLIFEAFQQADGSTSRNYGGTGLGLTISRELARLLRGEVSLKSELGKGSTFSIRVPEDHSMAKSTGSALDRLTEEVGEGTFTKGAVPPNRIEQSADEVIPKKANSFFLEDDRENIQKEDDVILVIEDDPKFAAILKKQINASGYKVLLSKEGADGLYLANVNQPVGIILDINLPDISGLKVLDQLKFNLSTRHIPVHVVSAVEANKDALLKGAIGFLPKPTSRDEISTIIKRLEQVSQKQVKSILIVEDDLGNRMVIRKVLESSNITIDESETGGKALAMIKQNSYDCVILDLRLPDMKGIEVLKGIKSLENATEIPVVIYTGKDLSKDEVLKLKEYADSIVIKGASSPERLLDEVSLFLHSVESKLNKEQKAIMRNLHDPESILKGRKVLLVDDDMRNTYALGKTLADTGIQVTMAENGKVAIEKLKADPELELILMDIMMPIMDGYQAMQEIRTIEKYKDLPIIALTAKAMQEDKAKCIQAGANDYLTKPVDTTRLLDMMRVWLYRRKDQFDIN